MVDGIDEGANDAIASMEGLEVGVEDSSNVGAGVGPSCGNCSCGDVAAISPVLGAEVGCSRVGGAVGVVGTFVGRRVGDLCKFYVFMEQFSFTS